MSDIFLSYASEDREQAAQLAQTLKACGWDVWWDRTLVVGDDYAKEIARQLSTAGCVIVLWSQSSVASGWVSDEANEAKGRDVYLPVCLDGTQPPLGFRSSQYADLSAWDGSVEDHEFQRLLGGIRRHAKGSPVPPPQGGLWQRLIHAFGRKRSSALFRVSVAALPMAALAVSLAVLGTSRRPVQIRRLDVTVSQATLVSSIWGMLCRSSVTIPLTVLKRLGLAAAGFILYNVANDGVRTTAEIAGGVAGLIFGVVVARDLSRRRPPVGRVAVAMSAVVVIAVAAAFPLGGITDARPEIERVVAVEDRTASAYEIAVKRFRNDRITAEALAQLIDRMIIPELQAADARLKTLDKVPQEQQPLVAGAEEYLRLRSDSWRFRAEGLRTAGILKPREDGRGEGESAASWRRRVEAGHRANSLTLGKAEGAERASLEALERIRP